MGGSYSKPYSRGADSFVDRRYAVAYFVYHRGRPRHSQPGEHTGIEPDCRIARTPPQRVSSCRADLLPGHHHGLRARRVQAWFLRLAALSAVLPCRCGRGTAETGPDRAWQLAPNLRRIPYPRRAADKRRSARPQMNYTAQARRRRLPPKRPREPLYICGLQAALRRSWCQALNMLSRPCLRQCHGQTLFFDFGGRAAEPPPGYGPGRDAHDVRQPHRELV